MDTSKSSLFSKFSQKPSISSIDNSKRIDDSTENYSLFEVNYDGMFDELPLSYEDVYGGGCFDISGLFKGFDCIEEPVGCDDGSLPVKIKDEFENEVILDDVVSSPPNFSMLSKRKGKSRVKFTQVQLHGSKVRLKVRMFSVVDCTMTQTTSMKIDSNADVAFTGPVKGNAVARRVIDDLVDISGKTSVDGYMRFFKAQQVAETCLFVNRVREEAQTSRNMIEVFDTLMGLRDDIRVEEAKLAGLNDLITQA
ncbi:hypothetical protein Tco_0952549 [Tanacetum coccineum]|uniref:Uncharacterized protein n=1 Tax=Tanacetum coccineum TaxID=301880 RepID=A0ABQ5DY88_9ASTR